MKTIFNKIKNYYYIAMLIGIILSVLWVIFVKTTPVSDFNYYNELAKDIANGGFWGDTRQAIGYPMTLGLVYFVFGASVLKAKIFNLLLTFINYILFYQILKKIELKERVRKVTFLIFILFPNNIFYNSILAKEILMTTALLLVTRIYLSKLKYKFVIVGILTGYITIIHASFLEYAFGIFLIELICSKRLKSTIVRTVVVVFCALVTISPLIYRNTKLMGQFTYVSTNSGVVLYINNNSKNNTGGWMSSADVENSVVNTKAYKAGNRATRSKIFQAAAKKWIEEHPKRFLQLGIMRLKNTYFAAEDTFWTFPGVNFSYSQKTLLQTTVKAIRKIIFLPAIIYILILSILKIKDIFKKRTSEDINYKFEIYLLMLFYMFSITQFITEGQSRYFFPLIFVMVFFFVQAISKIINIVLGGKTFEGRNFGFIKTK